jgi:hypothetical protein
MSEPFTKPERDALLARMRAVDAELYPARGPRPKRPQQARLRDTYYALLGEYSDRLPRVVMSVCPFTGAVVKRAFDPFGFDGPWWHKDRTFTPEEPAAPPTFKLVLGAVNLRGRKPAEADELVLAGPDAPFVVPRLMELPGMVAVIHRLEMATGDVAWPIAYFSSEDIAPDELHQHWTRAELWFTTEEGNESWLAQNDPWDFDLAPWIAKGQVRWLADADGKAAVVNTGSCPYAGLPGDHLPQLLAEGERELDDAPSGEPVEPFEADDGEE